MKGEIDAVEFANGYHRILTAASVKGFDMQRFAELVEWKEALDEYELPF